MVEKTKELVDRYGRTLVVIAPLLLLSLIVLCVGPMLKRTRQHQPSIKQYEALIREMDDSVASITQKLELNPDPVDWAALREWERKRAVRPEPVKPTPKPEPKIVMKPRPEPKPGEPRIYSLDGLHLHGILWQSDLPVALINGQVLGVGDRISDLKVTSISRDLVAFLDPNGKTHEYNAYEDIEGVYQESVGR